ncbi:hypothetical protein GCM10025762_15180 [Haloechinothrix salitolerans]
MLFLKTERLWGWGLLPGTLKKTHRLGVKVYLQLDDDLGLMAYPDSKGIRGK